MEREIPNVGEQWKHFKGNIYKIIACPVIDTTTAKQVVCYQQVCGNFTFVRPLDEFMSEVDKKKYPKVTETYRYKKVEE